MVTADDLARACPAKVWAEHKFTEHIELVNGKQVVIRFEMPLNGSKPYRFTEEVVQEHVGPILDDPMLPPDILSAITSLFNQRIDLTITDVRNHLLLTGKIMELLAVGDLLAAYMVLRILTEQLIPYAGDIWLYEWPEFIGMLEKYIMERVDETTLKIIQNMPRIV